MSNNKQHINSKDEFSELIKRKMENFSVPVDDACWSEIEKRIQPQKRRLPLWSWLSAASVAAGLALLFTLNPFSSDNATEDIFAHQEQHKAKTETIKPIQNQSEFAKEEITSKENTESVSSSENNTYLAKARVSNQKKNPENVIIAEEKKDEVEVIVEDITEEQNTKENIASKEEEVPVTKQITEEKKVKLTRLEDINTTDEKSDKALRKNKKWSLALAYGSSNGKDASNNRRRQEQAPSSMKSFGLVSKKKTTSDPEALLAESSFSDIQFSAPLSLGLSLRKDIGDKLDIITGLRYTYLHTHFEKDPSNAQVADLQLHYLGIPVNVAFNLYENQKWNIYLSGGMTVEKGIETYKQKKIDNPEILPYVYLPSHSIGPKLTEGIQLSANFSMGTVYEIYRNVGLYIEPSLAYYFDGGQPTSIRTKQPLAVNLNIGLQYKL